ncbi:hypothetical protein AB0O01_07215 [Streptomyces sp. NPDC093252]|uniref:hypothetical protein n=1 Tax=Streptomyces sp. NPDC093252 TaxID=3154980 RepID=UPI0034403AF1
MTIHSSGGDTRTAPRWSRLLLWPGSILLVVHAVIVMSFDLTDVDEVNTMVRFMGAASVVPILAQALLTAGLISLVLEGSQAEE